VSEIPAEVHSALEGLRSLGGDALLKQMVAVFVDYSRDRIQALQAAAAAGDLAAAASAAHTLKGSARQLGFLAMGDACVAVEQASKQGDAAATQLHAAAVHAQYTTAVEWLTSATA
jgi:HPt (histidine-containing phosphotransfer) domain-containing protein